jgi:hypothetical protein
MMNLISDVFLWSENKGLFTSKYESDNIDIEKLSLSFPNDRTAEHIDNCIDGVITLILSLKDELKTVEKVEEYIKAVLIHTEINESLNNGN